MIVSSVEQWTSQQVSPNYNSRENSENSDNLDDPGPQTTLDKKLFLWQLPYFSLLLECLQNIPFFFFWSHLERVYMWEISKSCVNWDTDNFSGTSLLTQSFRNIFKLNILCSLNIKVRGCLTNVRIGTSFHKYWQHRLSWTPKKAWVLFLKLLPWILLGTKRV